jgi:hypothetical protein
MPLMTILFAFTLFLTTKNIFHMRILTLFLALCLLAFNAHAQCIERLTVTNCERTLRYADLSTTGAAPYTAYGAVSIVGSGGVNLYTGELPYNFPSNASGREYEVFYSSAGDRIVQCVTTVSVQTPTSCLTCPAPTTAPSTSVNPTTNQVTLTVPAVAGATGYIYELNSPQTNGGSTTLYSQIERTTNTLVINLARGTTSNIRYRVRCSPTEISLPSPITTYSQTCDPPTITSATPVQSGANMNVTVAWSFISGVSGYILEYRPSSSTGAWQSIRNTSNIPQATISSISAGTTYSFRVSTICFPNVGSEIISLPSFERTFFIPLPLTCAAPTAAPSITVVNATQIDISWPRVTGAFGYILEIRNVTAGLPFGSLPTTSNTTRLTTAAGFTYEFRYRVRCTSTLTSSISPTGTFSASCPSTNFTSLQPIDEGNTVKVTASWMPVVGVGGYRVQYYPEGEPNNAFFAQVAGANTTTLTTLPNLRRGVNYVFQIAAVCVFTVPILSPFSEPRSLFIPCPTPTGLRVAYNAANNSANLSWSSLLSNPFGHITEYRPVGSTGEWQTLRTVGPATTVTVYDLTRGQNYEFRVSTWCNGTTQSEPSTVSNLLVPCPSLSTAPNVEFNSTNNTAVLNWAAVEGVEKYKVEYRADVIYDPWQSVTTTTNSAVIAGIIGGLQYQFRVTTVCPAASGVPLSAEDLTVPCGAMPAVFVNDLTTNSAVLTWDFANGAQSYDFISADDNITTTVISPPYILKGLLPDNTYEFIVAPKCRLSDGAGYKVIFTTPPSPNPTPCIAPSVIISNIKSTTALVQWSPVNGVRRYIVRYKLSSETEWRSTTTFATKLQLEGLTPRDLGDYTYEVQVQSVCSNSSSSDFSSSTVFETKSSCPEIDALSVGYRTHSLAVVSWDAVEDATDGFTVEYYPIPYNADNTKTLNVATNAAVIEGLMPETEYGVRVKSLCNPKTSLFSRQITFRTTSVACPAPNKIKTSNVTTNSATVSWSNISLATGYEFAYKKASDANWTTIRIPMHFTALSGLSPATTYDMRVRSICAFNTQSEWSDVRSFETATANSMIIANNNNNNNNNHAIKQAESALFDVSISPNPTTGLVTLEIGSAQEQTLDIAVVNRLGQVVLQKKIEAITKGYSTLNLDLTNLPNDIYILRTFNGQTFKTDKIVLEH